MANIPIGNNCKSTMNYHEFPKRPFPGNPKYSHLGYLKQSKLPPFNFSHFLRNNDVPMVTHMDLRHAHPVVAILVPTLPPSPTLSLLC